MNEKTPQWTLREAIFICAVIVGIEIIFFINQRIILSNILMWTGTGRRTGALLYILFIRLIDLLVILCYSMGFKKKVWVSLGLSPDNLWGKIKYGLYVCLIFGGSVLVVEILFYLLFSVNLARTIVTHKRNILLQNGGYIFAYIAAVVIYGPFIEEILFRGILYPSLRIHLSGFFAIFFNALIFASSHGANTAFFLIQFTGGIIFAYCYEKTDSIIPSYIVHSVGNFALFSLNFLNV